MPPKPAKKPNKAPNDPRLVVTIRTLNNLKASKPAWEELVKLGSKYHAAMETVSETAKAFIGGMKAAATNASLISSKDVAKELINIADIHERLETHRGTVKQSLMEGFLIPIKRSIDGERAMISNWEKNYQAQFKYMNAEIKKAEEASKSAGKKTPMALQQAILDLTNRVKELETARQNKLRELLLLEREKYCFLLLHYVEILKSELRLYEDGYTSFSNGISGWSDLAASKEKLPSDGEHLIVSKERTFVGIKAEGPGGVAVNTPQAAYGGGAEEDQWDEEEAWDEDTYDDGTGGAGGYNAAPAPPPANVSYGYNQFNYGSASAGIPAPPAPPVDSGYNANQYGGHQYNSHSGGYGGGAGGTMRSPPVPPPVAAKPAAAPPVPRRVRALYDNVADDAQELSFRAGDIIEVTKQVNDEWWAGYCNGQHGIFPSNYCTPI